MNGRRCLGEGRCNRVSEKCTCAIKRRYDAYRAFSQMTYAELCELEVIDAYTLQRAPVIDRLGQQLVHRQPWEKSAAYDGALHPQLQAAHLRAYTWMCEQFGKRMGRTPTTALVWLWFDAVETERTLPYMRHHADEHLLHLAVPVSELLVSIHRGWQDVLWDDPIFTPEPGRAMNFAEETKRASWETIFEIPASTPTCKLQAVMERIEPEWVREIRVLPPIVRHEQ